MNKLLKILSLLFIVISMAVNAQTSCNSPITSTIDTVCNYQNYYIPVGQGVSWHQFTGTGENVQMNLIQGFTVPGCVTKMTLLDSCNGTVLAMDSIVAGDSVLTLTAFTTVIGHSYKVLVEKNNSTFDANYEICFLRPTLAMGNGFICMGGSISSFTVRPFQTGVISQNGLCGGTNNNFCVHNPITPVGMDFVGIEVAQDFNIALNDMGEVYTWGQNGSGELAVPTSTPSLNCPFKTGICDAVKVDAGYQYSVVLLYDSTVTTFGVNQRGQLGNGNNTTTHIPQTVSSLTQVTDISTGYSHTLAIRKDGTVWSWGENRYGELGNHLLTSFQGGGAIASNVPVQVTFANGTPLTKIKQVSAGRWFSMALDSNGNVYTWGDNSFKQLGYATSPAYNHVPTMPFTNTAIDIACNQSTAFALIDSLNMLAWGSNSYGELANCSVSSNDSYPINATVFPSAVAKLVAQSSMDHSSAILKNGKIVSWGFDLLANNFGNCNGVNSCSYIYPDSTGCFYIPNEKPSLDFKVLGFPNDTAICNGSSILIDPTIFPQGGIYDWGNSNNDTTLFLTITNDTTVYLTYTFCNRVYTDSMKISLKTFSAAFEQDTIKVCYGTDSLLLPLIGVNGDAPFTYLWTPTNAVSCDTCPTPYGYLNPTGVTTFFLTVTDSNGCIGSDNINVLVTPQLTAPILLTGQIHSCTADSMYCFAPSGVTYNINAPTATFINQINSDCFTIKWNINPDGSSNAEQFTVIITDNAGCQDSSQINLIACCGGAVGGQSITFNDTKASQAFIDYPSPAHPSRTGISQFGTGWSNAISYTTANHIDINGTFTVDQNLTFEEANVKLSPYSKIVVNSGVTLTISGSYLHACQDTMWDGIYLKAGANLVVTSSYFEDALNAIVSENGAPYSITSSTFNKNYIGILIEPYTGSHTGFIDECTFSSVNLNNYLSVSGIFSGGSKLISPYLGDKAHIGVDVRSVYDIHIGDANYLNKNIFTNIENGIRTSYSGTKIENNTFTNIIEPGVVAFAPIHRAIWITNVASAGTQQSNNNIVFVWGANQNNKGNTFTNCQFGVWCNESHHLEILENDFTQIATAGIYYTNLTNINYNAVEVLDNTFTDCFRGVAAITNPRADSEIYKNTFTYTNAMTNGIGILIQENNTGARFNQHRLSAYCNTITEARTGVKLTNLIKTHTNRDNIKLYVSNNSNITSEGLHTQNCYGSDINQNTVYAANRDQNWTTGYRLDMGGNPRVTCNKASYLGKGYAFSGSQPGTYWAGNDMFHNYYGLELFNGGIIYDQVTNTTSGQLPNDNRWIGQYSGNYAHTYAVTPTFGNLTRLFVRPNGVFYPSVNKFDVTPIQAISLSTKNNIKCKYNCNGTNVGSGSAGDLLKISNGIAKKIVQDSVNFNQHQYEKALKWWNKKNLLTALLNDSIISPDSVLQQFKDSMQQAGFGILDSINGILCNPDNDTAIISPSITANLQAYAADKIDSNIKTINTICLVQQLAGRDLNAQEKQQLEQIAQLCPLTDGVAVYMARVILDPLDTIRYTNSCEIQSVTTNGNRLGLETDDEDYNQELEEEAGFMLYPNPNDGRITVNYKLSATQLGNLVIMDMMGKVLYEQELSPKKAVEQLNLTHLSKGVYLYTIQVNGEPKQNGKLVIQK